jgi:hypothetical protein
MRPAQLQEKGQVITLQDSNIDKALKQALQMFEEDPPDLLGADQCYSINRDM